jgi:hypothetical protein
MSMRSCALAILLVAIVIVPARPQTPSDRAKAADVHGRVERKTASNPDDRWSPIKVGDLLGADAVVRTAADSAVLLVLQDAHVVRIGENAMLELKELGQNNSFSFTLLRGRIWSFVDKAKKPAKYEVETPSTILGVSGTLFSVAHDEANGETNVSVDDGEVRLRQGQTSKNLAAGLQMGVSRNGLDQAGPQKHTPATLAMWKTIRSRETWAKPNGALRLNQQVEERARAIQQERQKEKQQQAPRTPKKPAPPPRGRAGGGGRK